MAGSSLGSTPRGQVSRSELYLFRCRHDGIGSTAEPANPTIKAASGCTCEIMARAETPAARRHRVRW
jgi:hypothetical protein